MPLFKKNGDPLSQRARELTAKIADLEGKIQQLHEKIQPDDQPRFRSTAYPQNVSVSAREPVFEAVDQNQLKNIPEPRPATGPLSELTAPKRDLAGMLDVVKKYFSGSPAANPKLLTYLAAGNVQGLRPLRYEKRVARNRFLALTLVFIAVLFGIFYFLARRR
jgi:cell division protein FtsB